MMGQSFGRSLQRREAWTRWYQTKTGVFGHGPSQRTVWRPSQQVQQARADNANLFRLVTAYRDHGHKTARTNPVQFGAREEPPELDPGQYGLRSSQVVDCDGITWVKTREGGSRGTVEGVVQGLRDAYCGTLAVEMRGLEEEQRDWLAERLETTEGGVDPSDKTTRTELLKSLLYSQSIDHFLAAKFGTLKRYGGEGAESMMAFFWQLLRGCKQEGVSDVVLAMPHRGRLNVLTALFHMPPQLMFRKIRGLGEFPETTQTTGDVLSHLTCSVDMGPVHVTMLPNPSHLEAVNPVSMGKARAKQLTRGDGEYGDRGDHNLSTVLNVQVHGDAAFLGQGINQETLSLSKAPHYQVGGSVHVVVNNQVGFTTPGERGRSSRYASDLAKIIQAPVIQVNGDHPEEVARATHIALSYQRRFSQDVFLELSCYRQWGHNEMDDPTFTNPELYRVIHGRPHTVPDLYASTLVRAGVVSAEEVEAVKREQQQALAQGLRDEAWEPDMEYFKKQWTGFEQAGGNNTIWDTGVDTELLRYVGAKSVATPDGFQVHPHLAKTHVTARLGRLSRETEPRVDWATAEALAMGSLLYQGFNVRISGQDVGRGTFSQRHAMLVDQKTNDMYIPLNHIAPDQRGKLEVANSILSEEAVLGFEYGFSIENPSNLVIWEAQFGDFFTGAQIIVDTFVSSGESKWLRSSGLVMLLPHGYDGAGPEHSSCRIERFLQMTDSSETKADGDCVNFQVAVPTTPAQMFHLLRRQMVRNYRKPLVVAGPKTLLRLPEATSRLEDMGPDTHFLDVLPDAKVSPGGVNRVVFVSGKHFYALDAERAARGLTDTAIVRVESLCPFPVGELQSLTRQYSKARRWVWAQEEPRNMGGWAFVRPRFNALVGIDVQYAGPAQLPTPAVGTGKAHKAAHRAAICQAFD